LQELWRFKMWIMTINSSYIYIDDVRFRAYHGVLPQERSVGADFLLSLRVGYPLERAMESDSVEDTLNYAELYELARREIAVSSCLLEHVAGRIAKAICSRWPEVTSVDLRLSKKNPPMGGDLSGAGVEIHLINDKTEA